MSEWLLQILLVILAVALFAGLVYSLLFSSRGTARAEDKPVFGGYDRREPERADRRKRNLPAPADSGDRRTGPRRTDE